MARIWPPNFWSSIYLDVAVRVIFKNEINIHISRVKSEAGLDPSKVSEPQLHI